MEHALLAWVLTYLLHGTLLLSVAWLATRRLPRGSWRLQELIWKTALFGPLATASVQSALALRPLGGSFELAALASPDAGVAPATRAASALPAKARTAEPDVADAVEPAPEPTRAREDASAAPAPVVVEPEADVREPRDEREALALLEPDALDRGRAATLLATPPVASSSAAASRPSTEPREPATLAAPVAPSGARTEGTPRSRAALAGPLARHGRDLVALRLDARAGELRDAVAALGWRRPLLAAWLGGGLLGLLLLAWAWTRLADHLAGRRALSRGPVHELLVELSARAGLRRAPRLFVSTRLASPATVGVLAPRVCLPERVVEELGRDQQEAILAHELAHVAHHDPLWMLLACVVERLFFLQPLNRVARHELADLAEFRSDAWAAELTGRGLCLARCLAEVASWMVAQPVPVAMRPMAARNSRLAARIRALLETRTGASRQRRASARLAAPAAVLSLAAIAWTAPGIAAGARAATPAEPAPRAEAGDDERRDEPAAAATDAGDDLAPLALEIERMLERLDGEVGHLMTEVDALAGDIGASDLGPEFTAPLERLAQRVERLRLRQARLQDLVPTVLGSYREGAPSPPSR